MPCKILLISMLCSVVVAASAQSEYPAGPKTITLSAKTLLMSDELPFDNPFILLLNDLDKLTDPKTVELKFCEGGDPSKLKPLKQTYHIYGGAFYMVFPHEEFSGEKGKFLLPNRVYTFEVTVKDSKNVEILKIQRSSYTRTKFGDHVKADFGFGYSPNINGIFGYTSAHIYFYPMNNDTDLGKISGFSKQLYMRTSLFFGLTPLIIYTDTKQPIEKLTGSGNFIYGAGIRSPFYGWKRHGGKRVRTFLQPMRLVVGSIVFKQVDENPLITKMRVKQSFYIGLSYDFNLASLFNPIAKLYTP